MLHRRIAEVNAAIDLVTSCYAARCLDLHTMPGAYDLASWSVDRLHPSELGHRLLARGFADLLAGEYAVPFPVELTCSGGRRSTVVQHAAWLAVRGLPWLWRRGRDLLPYGVDLLVRELVRPNAPLRAAPSQPPGAGSSPSSAPAVGATSVVRAGLAEVAPLYTQPL